MPILTLDEFVSPEEIKKRDATPGINDTYNRRVAHTMSFDNLDNLDNLDERDGGMLAGRMNPKHNEKPDTNN